jgi:hypothetical protein
VKGVTWFSVFKNGKEVAFSDIRYPNERKWKLNIDWKDIEISGEDLCL